VEKVCDEQQNHDSRNEVLLCKQEDNITNTGDGAEHGSGNSNRNANSNTTIKSRASSLPTSSPFNTTSSVVKNEKGDVAATVVAGAPFASLSSSSPSRSRSMGESEEKEDGQSQNPSPNDGRNSNRGQQLRRSTRHRTQTKFILNPVPTDTITKLLR